MVFCFLFHFHTFTIKQNSKPAGSFFMSLFKFFKQLFSKQKNYPELEETSVQVQPLPVKEPVKPAVDPLDSINEHFINKGCTSLDEFIINEEINAFDLQKLAWLNGIALQIQSGWYDLLKRLLIELNEAGWNKRVSCIKEKYAELRFHAADFDEIIDRYTAASKWVCETCGEKGKIRSKGGWDYGACRKHYIETRSSIAIVTEGFTLNEKMFYWKDIISAGFADEPNYYGDYHLLKITFPKNFKAGNSGWDDHILYLRSNDYGWGAFMQAIAGRFNDIDEGYLSKFGPVECCKTCGYLAVYNNKCECCEETIYSEKDHSYYDGEEDYYKRRQLYWYDDEGDVYEAIAPHYPQSPGYIKLVNDEEVKQHHKDIQALDFL